MREKLIGVGVFLLTNVILWFVAELFLVIDFALHYRTPLRMWIETVGMHAAFFILASALTFGLMTDRGNKKAKKNFM